MEEGMDALVLNDVEEAAGHGLQMGAGGDLCKRRRVENSRSATDQGGDGSTNDESGVNIPFKIIDPEFLKRFDFAIAYLECWSSYQMETVIDELIYLRYNLLDVLQLYSHEDSCNIGMEVLCLSAKALIDEIQLQRYFSRQIKAGKLSETVDSLKKEASVCFSRGEIYSPPSSNGVDSVDCLIGCLIENVEVLSHHLAASVFQLKPQIESYYQEIKPLRKFLRSQTTNDLVSNSQMGMFTELFHQLTCKFRAITGSFLRGDSIWRLKLGLFVITNEVKVTCQKMKQNLMLIKATDRDDISTSSVSSKRVMNSIDKAAPAKIVGVKDAENVIELLTRGTNKLQIVSIVGMPGLGKTTMANYAYDHQSVSLHFHIRAWFCVSQAYNKATLLADLLSQVVGDTKTSHEEVSGNDLAHMLYKNLKGRRYLIVMDDIWDIEIWEDLKQTFPDDGNQSRILFTTRHLDVARKSESVHYNLSLLSDDESCKLLWSKVFDKETCPFTEVVSTSRRIAKNCRGLPLAIVLMAGILRNAETRKESWEQVAERDITLQFEHDNQSDAIQFRNIFELSYTNLPVELRSCFLYFATFPKDSSISVSKLLELWISEGFVHEKNLCSKNLEEEAECYLGQLIDRSLVMIAQRSSRGGVKACHIHDALWNFCSEKSREEDLISKEPMFGGIIWSQYSSFIYYNIPTPAFKSVVKPGKQLPEKPVNEHLSEGRVFIDKIDPHTGYSEGANLLGIKDDVFPCGPKHLKVLDLRYVRIQSSADTSDIITIATLIHLRFLRIRPRLNEIPAEIGNLLKLEILILTGVIGIVKLPESLWKLPRLRNFLMDYGFFDFQHCSSALFENFFYRGQLRSVSTLSRRHGDNVENRALRRFPNLKKLACRFVYSWDEATGCSVFPVLDFLNHLKSLKLFFSGVMRYPCRFSFPSSLKKLSLSNSRLPWIAFSVIMEQLKNLEVLKLLSMAFVGQQWDMGDCDILFPKLKFLKLDSLDIQVWNADDCFPCLEQLVVLSCPQLEEIPSCFGEIPTLQSIEMKWCSSSVMQSVRQILRDQRELSNDDLKVTLIGL